MKLWQKDGYNTDEVIEKFTVGRDQEFDVMLAKYDVEGSIAHVTMLGEVGLMTPKQALIAVDALRKIAQEIEEGGFTIDEGIEDVHSQVEFLLSSRIGDIGKMIHSGRSRNDQVAVDIKLFLRDQIRMIASEVKSLFDLLQKRSEELKDFGLPGYTHLQIAMPSSFGLWLGAYAESLVDDVEMLGAAYLIVNKNPLGSGAGYGSTFPLNRKRTTELLNFNNLNWNSAYAQMTRGKAEKTTGVAISFVASTLSRLAMDCCLYMNQNFGFIKFPDQLTTGSSIMPHKKNPDVFELIRAKCNRIQSVPNELNLMLTNLPSGYHRDLQLTKEILFPALEELKACLAMMSLMIKNMSVKSNILDDDKYKYLFTVDAVNQLVISGMTFRDAYVAVGNQVQNGTFQRPELDISELKAHEGSVYNLCTNEIGEMMNEVIGRFGF